MVLNAVVAFWTTNAPKKPETMQRKLPLKSVELDKFLVSIRERIPFKEICANPFLYLVKPTEENLSKYIFYRPDGHLFYIFDLLTFGLRIILNVAITICVSILRSWQNLPWDIHLQHKKEILFISHFTKAQDTSKEDTYLGSLVNPQQDFIFYLNHTRINAQKISSRFEEQGKFNFAVNSKSLSPNQTFIVQISQMRVSGWLFLKSLPTSRQNIGERRLMLRAAIWQHSRATMSNFTLKNRLTRTILKLEPNFLVLPLEGHAHEAMIMNLRENKFKDLRIVGYQHAPVVPGQMNLKYIIHMLNDRDYCLTTGEIVKMQLFQANTKCKMQVIGTPKSQHSGLPAKDYSRIKVLVAPEGNKDSILKFISLIKELSHLLPWINFVLRPHPGFEGLNSRTLSKTLIDYPNIEMSISDLSADLSNSHFVLFRSSAVGIQGLLYGNQPIHWDYFGNDLLNPFSQTNFNVISGKDALEIASLLSKFDIESLKSHEFQNKCSIFFNSYFSECQNLRQVLNIL